MLKIQIITNNPKLKNIQENTAVSSFSAPRSLDEFEINIIDLGYEEMWKFKERHKGSLNCAPDLNSIKEMVQRREVSTVMYVLPQNTRFKYSYKYSGADRVEDYREQDYLKNMLDNVCLKILPLAIPEGIKTRYLSYENTTTRIGDREYKASFYFTLLNESPITVSNLSGKVTTVKLNERLLLTTLDVTSSIENIVAFVQYVAADRSKINPPEWIESIHFLDDEKQKNTILNNQEIIRKANDEINQAERQLDNNMKYKSILYTSGKELEDVVRNIMEQLTGASLENYTDRNKEDFLIQCDHCALIGEIKGVSSNVKRRYVAQVDQHYQDYVDKIEEEGGEKEVLIIKQLLIINPLRDEPLEDREPINQEVINTAKRNGCLIIETKTLLSLYEQYRRNELTTDDFIEIVLENEGLLSIQ